MTCDTAMHNKTAAIAARIATDKAAADALQQLLREGRELADAMAALAEVMGADRG